MKSNYANSTRKILAYLFFFFTFFANIMYAQDSFSGIYISESDFIQHKISFQSSEKTSYKLKLHAFFYKPYLEIKANDSVFKFNKSDIFAYVDKEKICYRFYNAQIYTILNPTEKILLYKNSVPDGTKGLHTIVSYSFSKSPSAEILPLSFSNLKKTFEKDSIFQMYITLYMKNETELWQYDSDNKQYRLNYLYKISQKEANIAD
jgi:hypothetical protein